MGIGHEEPGVDVPSRERVVESSLRGPWLTPLSITAIYLLLGGLALFLSDVVFPYVLSEPQLTEYQAVKGAVEVVLTAGLIYLLTHRQATQLAALRGRIQNENRELQLLHRVLRHNLRNDVNVLLGSLERLRTLVPDPDLPDECERIEMVGERIERYTEAARNIRKVNERREATATFDLRSLVDGGLAQAGDGDVPADVTLDLPDLLPIRGNHMLPTAVAELLSLAVGRSDYRSRDGSIRIETASADDSATVDAGAVGLCLSGEGLSIPQADLEALERGSEDELVHATGMELWFVVWAIERSGGTIEWRGDDDRPALCLSLPSPD